MLTEIFVRYLCIRNGKPSYTIDESLVYDHVSGLATGVYFRTICEFQGNRLMIFCKVSSELNVSRGVFEGDMFINPRPQHSRCRG
jgi:hypothetical protein